MSLVVCALGCVEVSATRPCTDDDRCLPGFQCIAEVCEPCEFDQCPTSQVTLVSTGGGLACGPDGTCVRFPAGALTGVSEIEIARTDNPVTFIGASAISRVYAVRPAGLTPREPVEVVMSVSRRIEEGGGRVMILRALGPRGPWESLDTVRDTTRASAYSPLLGLFVLARDVDGTTARDAGPSTDATPGVDVGPLMRTDPLPGIGAAIAVPGPLTSLHALAWDAAQNRMLLSDTNSNVILGFAHTGATPNTTPATVRMDANGTFGLVADAAGNIYMLERMTRRIAAMMGNGAATPLVENFGGLAFNSPVDAAVRSDGTLYFTDPATGLAGRPRQITFNGVFRRTPQGALTAESEGALTTEPRGIELSPDEATLYVADTANQSVLAWSVGSDGALSGARTFAATTATPDGLAVDREGNVYVGTAAGVEVFGPDGARWGSVAVPAAVGGVAFGGPGFQTLYFTTSTTLYYAPVTIAGVR